MQRIPKRDIHGYVIRDELTTERYIFCPKIASLLWLKKCEKCEFFRGAKKYNIRCTCKTESKPPAYYDRKAPNSAGQLFAKMYAKKIIKKTNENERKNNAPKDYGAKSRTNSQRN